jgi:chloramphenicol 3-O phosphotransferase
MKGTIIVLNGAPRSGKSSIAHAIQQSFEGVWVNLGVDVYMAATPQLSPGIGLRPGGERPDLEPLLPTLYAGLYESIAAHSRLGLNVVADLGHHDFYSTPLGILPDCARRLAGLPALLIGVRCPIEVIMARRNADSHGGFYETGAVAPVAVTRWQDAVHTPGIYDLEVDSSVLAPEQSAAAIGTLLQNWPKPSAFEKLAKLHS